MSSFDSQDIDPSESISQIEVGFRTDESLTFNNFGSLLSSSPNVSSALSPHSIENQSKASSSVDRDNYLFIKKDDILLARAVRILGVCNYEFEKF
jgi:hypothetical protein